MREARSAAGFAHPDAVAVYDAGESDGYLFLVMELVDGSSLAERLAERGRLDVDEALRITRRVLAALGAAHQAGIVHRDVKPANVLLGAAGEVKLADFGIAKRLGDIAADVTSSGQFVGTPKYLAPEQVVGERSTPATDLYAVGVVLYEMLAGRPPYDAGNPMATAIAHRDAPIPDLHRARPDLPAPVVAVVRRAMAKRPAERFGSAAEMTAALVSPPAAARPSAVPAPAPVRSSGPSPARKPEPTAGHGRATVPPAEGVVVGGGRGCRRRWWGRSRRRSAGRPARRLGRSARNRVAGDDDRRPNHDRRPDHDARSNDDDVAPTTTVAPTTPPPTLPPLPDTIEELIAWLEADLGSLRPAGTRTSWMSSARSRRRTGGSRLIAPRSCSGRRTDWVDDGELSGELAPIAEAAAPPDRGRIRRRRRQRRRQHGPGNGRGRLTVRAGRRAPVRGRPPGSRRRGPSFAACRRGTAR